MKVRIRVAFTVDVHNDQDATRILANIRERIWTGNVYSGDADDVHLIARKGGKTLAEMGKSPKEKP